MILLLVPIPETTSAEAFERYVGGNCLRASRGKVPSLLGVWYRGPFEHNGSCTLRL